MRTISMATLLVLLIVCASARAAQPTLPGTWKNARHGFSMTLDPQGSFSFRDAKSTHRGRWGIQGRVLGLQANQGRTVYYQVRFLTTNALGLMDQRGQFVNYSRMPGPVSKKPHARAPKPPTARPRPPRAPKGHRRLAKGPILSTKGGFTLRQRHLDAGIGILQFTLGQRLSRAEKRAMKKELIIQFRKDPGPALKECETLGQNLSRLLSIKNPIQVCVLRLKLVSAIYNAALKLPPGKRPAFLRVLLRRAQIVAADPKTGLVLQAKDLNALVRYYEFCNKCYGELMYTKINIPAGARQRFRNSVINNFAHFPNEKKQFICSASLVWDSMQAAWRRMNHQQQRNAMAKICCRFPDPANQPRRRSGKSGRLSKMRREMIARQNMFGMMQNATLGNHVMMLNVNENLANTGVEWKLEPQY